jgi:ribosomal-protein-alanine N-acetyltransferase
VEWVSERLVLRPMPAEAVEAILQGDRSDDWAEDFPTEGDAVIARLLQAGEATPGHGDEVLGHRQVVERSTGIVVGGIGVRETPEDGTVEVGYGMVPSRQGRGYATEAVVTLLAAVWRHEDVRAVVAETLPDNVGSQRVLGRAGFIRNGEAEGGEWRYRIERPVGGTA